MRDSYTVADSNGTSASREYGWTVGFGLQAADGLIPSEYAYQVAQEHIDCRSYGELRIS